MCNVAWWWYYLVCVCVCDWGERSKQNQTTKIVPCWAIIGFRLTISTRAQKRASEKPQVQGQKMLLIRSITSPQCFPPPLTVRRAISDEHHNPIWHQTGSPVHPGPRVYADQVTEILTDCALSCENILMCPSHDLYPFWVLFANVCVCAAKKRRMY